MITEQQATEVLNKLCAGDDILVENLEHFRNESETRDQVVESYFGEGGLDFLVDTLSEKIFENIETEEPKILDVGCGTGTFTVRIQKILEKMGLKPQFYALDASYLMLNKLIERAPDFGCSIGLYKKIRDSIQIQQDVIGTAFPKQFDVIMSTLALHHIPDKDSIFLSVFENLSPDGFAINCDVGMWIKEGEHKPYGTAKEDVLNACNRYFNKVQYNILPNILCTDQQGFDAPVFIVECKHSKKI